MGKRFLDNDGKHLYDILMQVECKKHLAETGMPCFAIFPDTKDAPTMLSGACGSRIRKAGFNGKISETSYQNKRPTGPSEGRKTHHKKKEAA